MLRAVSDSGSMQDAILIIKYYYSYYLCYWGVITCCLLVNGRSSPRTTFIIFLMFKLSRHFLALKFLSKSIFLWPRCFLLTVHIRVCTNGGVCMSGISVIWTENSLEKTLQQSWYHKIIRWKNKMLLTS